MGLAIQLQSRPHPLWKGGDWRSDHCNRLYHDISTIDMAMAIHSVSGDLLHDDQSVEWGSIQLRFDEHVVVVAGGHSSAETYRESAMDPHPHG